MSYMTIVARDHRDRIIRYHHFSLEWTPRLRGQFWTGSLNEIAETGLAQRSEFWKDKKRAVVRMCRDGPSPRTTGYIRSESKVSIISSTISSYLVVRERQQFATTKKSTLEEELVTEWKGGS